MEDRELDALLTDLESDRVERKASLSEQKRIREAICAFANDLPGSGLPGILFVGANDDGSPSGLPITDQLLLTLSDMRSDGNITPFPSMVVQKRLLRGAAMAVAIVQPSDAPPVRFDGRIWIRVGPRRAVATPEEERRLTEKRRFRDLPYDIRPVESATLQNLNMELFRGEYLPQALPPEILQQNSRELAEQLSSLRFATADAPQKPTVLGILVTGKDPQQFLPGAYVQFVRFDGTQLLDPIKSQKEIGGPLPDLLRMLDAVFEAHVSVQSDIRSAAVERRTPDYPAVAFQQIARNAVLHRNYEGTNAPVRVYWFSDRIEISSPGGPYGQVSRSNFGQPGITDYRNPHLAEAMKNLGYVQRFGVGIQFAKTSMEENGNPPIEFTVEDSYVLVTLRGRQ
ncbi:MAG: putative DNA binding domain-containing protein [Bryobacterales bacterium]|nr:putative DNA binding domain-containing protein [Bryobacterales bacterium]